MIPTEKILVAAEKRRPILGHQTNALRLFDGAGDGLPGLSIDDFAGRWIVQTLDEREPGFDPELGFRSLYWKPLVKTFTVGLKHLAGEPVAAPFGVLESGLRYEIDFQAGYFSRAFSRPANQSEQTPQPLEGHDTPEHLLLHLCLRRSSSHRRRFHRES